MLTGLSVFGSTLANRSRLRTSAWQMIVSLGVAVAGAVGDQQHRVATALYEDLARIVAMVLGI